MCKWASLLKFCSLEVVKVFDEEEASPKTKPQFLYKEFAVKEIK